MKSKRGLLDPGSKILNGRYEILKIIQSKGMSNVYLVMDTNLNKQWCLKEIRKSEAGRDNYEYYALLQEANIMKSLNHPKIPRITTIDEEGDSIFIIMDYIDGISVKSHIAKNGRIPQDTVVNWTIQVVEVLSYLHSRKKPIFYRDMKPDNIMVRGNGDIAIIDFGISIVIEEPNQVIDKPLGTKGYAAPGQSKRGSPVDLRDDIYSLGRTMYCMLTGINPSLVKEDKLRNLKELVPNISTGVEHIVNKCMQPDPNMRYQSCEELLVDLQSYGNYDEKYIKGIKAKLRLIWGLFGLSIFLIGTSFIPLALYKNQNEDRYNTLVSVAKQSGRSADYEAIFDFKSDANLDLYTEYIESLKVDGEFTKDEEQALLNYINPNIDTMKTNQDYGKFAYEMGKLYWFYYTGNTENEGIITSVKWFADSRDAGYEPELSDVYYQLGMFNRNILSSIAESEDVGMYSDYWNNLLKIKETETGELITLQINLCIANCISNYGYNLKNDGITKEQMEQQLSDLSTFVNTYSPNSENATNLYNRLSNLLDSLTPKVESLFSQGGDD